MMRIIPSIESPAHCEVPKYQSGHSFQLAFRRLGKPNDRGSPVQPTPGGALQHLVNFRFTFVSAATFRRCRLLRPGLAAYFTKIFSPGIFDTARAAARLIAAALVLGVSERETPASVNRRAVWVAQKRAASTGSS